MGGTAHPSRYLVRRAILVAERCKKTNTMLPTSFSDKEVVEYFISYLDRDGRSCARSGCGKVTEYVERSQNIADKPKISGADVQRLKV